MLSSKKRYLQVALNSDLSTAEEIINSLPVSDRIILEAGTPLIKKEGVYAIERLYKLWDSRLYTSGIKTRAYIVADLKTMDRGETEVALAASAGASAAVCLGRAPVETIDSFIQACRKYKIDPMLDMMNVERPYRILRSIKTLPKVVILHRGVDEERFSDKPLPIHMINKIKGAYDLMIAVAGGDTEREVRSAVFNGADIVVLWKSFYTFSRTVGEIATRFLKDIK